MAVFPGFNEFRCSWVDPSGRPAMLLSSLGEPDLGDWLDEPGAFMRSELLAAIRQNVYGLESAKPDLQSTFKKPGGDPAAG